MSDVIVYQGESGAYSHLACEAYFPHYTPLPCASFASAFARVRSGEAQLAMIPVENTVAGRVSDIYHLLPEGGLHIIGERYLAVHHQLLGIKGANKEDIKTARSHPMALGQVRKKLVEWNIRSVADVDTAGAARKVAELGDNWQKISRTKPIIRRGFSFYHQILSCPLLQMAPLSPVSCLK